MAQSYSTTGSTPLASLQPSRRKVLVTGAAGTIGSYFARHAAKQYQLRLQVRELDEESSQLEQFGEVVVGELSDLEGVHKQCEGVDTVLHLAANPSPSASWQSVLDDNITGTYNVFVAARAAGCRRVIYASSIHAVSGYPADVQVKTSEPVNPGDLYGVSKCFGEAMGRYMAEQEGLSVIAVRIGGFQPHATARKEDLGLLDAWVSPRDLQQLLQNSVDAEGISFAIVHGLSNNRFKRLDLTDTKELLGYNPQDDFTAENPLLQPLNLAAEVNSHSQADEGQKSGIREELSSLGQG